MRSRKACVFERCSSNSQLGASRRRATTAARCGRQSPCEDSNPARMSSSSRKSATSPTKRDSASRSWSQATQDPSLTRGAFPADSSATAASSTLRYTIAAPSPSLSVEQSMCACRPHNPRSASKRCLSGRSFALSYRRFSNHSSSDAAVCAQMGQPGPESDLMNVKYGRCFSGFPFLFIGFGTPRSALGPVYLRRGLCQWVVRKAAPGADDLFTRAATGPIMTDKGTSKQ
jgi:hypothetical protein